MSEKVEEAEQEQYVREQEEAFKKEKFYFSFSSLVKLMLDPRVFYKDYILREREEISGKYLDIGELLHCLVLEPENFDEKFVIMPKKVPGGKIKTVIDNVYKTYAKTMQEKSPNAIITLDMFEEEIIEELASEDLYQSYVDNVKAVKGVMITAKMKQLEKAITDETIQYFNILLESTRRTVVDMDMAQKAHDKANAILDDPKATILLNPQNQKEDVRTELELKADLKDYPFGLKGIIDCVKIDYENATIHIIDLKTTSKGLRDWDKSFLTSEYNYWLQPIVYKELLLSLIPKDSLDKWKMKVHYIVVDKDNQVYCYPVSPQSLTKWELMAKGAYDIGKWHLETSEYKLPYNYAKNLVEL